MLIVPVEVAFSIDCTNYLESQIFSAIFSVQYDFVAHYSVFHGAGVLRAEDAIGQLIEYSLLSCFCLRKLPPMGF